jgi:hypothetical protein
MERAISSSHSSNGKTVASIDEESDTQFPMEDEEDSSPHTIGGLAGSVSIGPPIGLALGEQEWDGYGSSAAGKRFH